MVRIVLRRSARIPTRAFVSRLDTDSVLPKVKDVAFGSSTFAKHSVYV